MRLLLDTNVLVLFLAGLVRPDRIGGKRLEKFIAEDFLRVAEWAGDLPDHISLPNILTEASNLLGDERQELWPGSRQALANYVSNVDEVYVPSQRVAAGPEYLRLGLTDAAIHDLADNEVCVVSVDHHLCNRLNLNGVDVRNPFHFR